MVQRVFFFFLFFIVINFSFVFAQKSCEKPKLVDSRDNTVKIPGVTKGQKLETVLFWNQAQKERRFPMMQSIFPSTPVKAGHKIRQLPMGKKIIPKWKDSSNLKTYMDENHIAGLIVLQNGKVRLENYGNGVNKNTLWTSFSVAKSVSSMLVGAALQDGYIKSLDDSLQQYIPEFKGYDYGKVTVRQLLTMTSGIAWSEDYTNSNSDVAMMYLRPCKGKEAHIVTFMKPMVFDYEHGKVWHYSTGETDLVGILIQKATGKNLSDYLSEKIWQPFGMQQCAYWLTDECSGLNLGGSGLSASLRDYARLGLLMLADGKINGQQILSKEWLKQATKPLFKTNDKGGGYGYLWWCNADSSYAAHGIFGQMIYVNPKTHLIIAQIAAWPQASTKILSLKEKAFIKAIEDAIANE